MNLTPEVVNQRELWGAKEGSYRSYRGGRCNALLIGVPFVLCLVVGLPGLIDDVGVNSIGFLDGHPSLEDGESRRIPEAWHPIPAMTARQNDRIPLAMCS